VTSPRGQKPISKDPEEEAVTSAGAAIIVICMRAFAYGSQVRPAAACLFNARPFITHMTILANGRVVRWPRRMRDLTCGLRSASDAPRRDAVKDANAWRSMIFPGEVDRRKSHNCGFPFP